MARDESMAQRWRRVWGSDGWVRPYVGRYRGVLVLSLVLGVLTMVASSGLMFTSGCLISGAAERPLEGIFALFTPLALVQIFGIGKPFAGYLERLCSHDWVLRMTSALRLRLYRAIEKDALFWTSARRTGDVLGLLAQDIAHVQDLYLRVVFPTVIALVLWLGVSLLFGFFSPLFGLAMLLVLGVVVVLVPCVSVLVNGARQMRRDALASQLYARVTDDVLGVGDWVCSGREEDFVERVARVQTTRNEAGAAMARFDRRRDLLVQLLLGACAVAILVWAAYYFGTQPQAAAATGVVGRPSDWIAAFVLGFFPLVEAFVPLSSAAVEANGHLGAVERMNALGSVPDDAPAEARQDVGDILAEVLGFDRAMRISSQQGAVPEALVPGEPLPLRLRGVDFTYPEDDRAVLRGFDLTVRPGEKVAILGPSGAGKSTLLALMRGDREPSGGAVLLGDAPASSYGDTMPRYMAAIQQDTYLFNETLLENLRVANPAATEAEAQAALEAVGLGGLLTRLPQGLHTMVDEAGLRFSGGERHRVALARVLLQGAPIVLLDEPTVGLDPATEAALLATVFEVLADRTIVMVTHHLVGVGAMDRVVFVEDGHVALEGSPAELEATSNRYRQLLAFDRGL